MSHRELEEIAGYIRDLLEDGYAPTMKVVTINGMTFNAGRYTTACFSEDEKPKYFTIFHDNSVEFISIENILCIEVVKV